MISHALFIGSHAKYPTIFARALGARHRYPIFSLKRRKKRNIFRLRLRRAEKIVDFYMALRKHGNLLKCWWFAPLWKNSCGRP